VIANDAKMAIESIRLTIPIIILKGERILNNVCSDFEELSNSIIFSLLKFKILSLLFKLLSV
jgi:hypothetical protein